jgi:DNA processing protein
VTTCAILVDALSRAKAACEIESLLDFENVTTEAAAWVQLTLIPGLGDESLRRLLAEFGSPEEVFAAPAHALKRVVKAPVAAAINKGVDAAALAPTLRWLAMDNHYLVALGDAHYPPQLLNIADPPPLLYVVGRRELLTSPSLAVVGSRNASAQGSANAERFAHALSDAGLTIVSGLALGVDAAAHRGGLKGRASSIAVIGTGLDIVYPKRNLDLAKQLAQHGAIVSEFALGTPALANNFPRRNRIISGLAKGCLVVEATTSSGSLITARLATEQGREVFAIPGSIHSPFARGCHALIKQGAKLVESAQDVLEEIGWATRAQRADAENAAPETEDALLTHMGFDPVGVDDLIARSGLGADEINSQLLQFELDGLICSLPGGRYQRLK